MILDIIIIAVVALMVFIGYKMGLARTLFGLLSTFAALAAAY